MREEPDLLDHVARLPPEPDRIPRRRRAPGDAHLAAGRHQQRVHELQRRRLSRAAPSDQRDGLAFRHRQREAAEDGRPAGEPEARAGEFDEGRPAHGAGLARGGDALQHHDGARIA